MSCYGDPNIATPNLDRLAREGIRFTNAYSNTPLCSPFRACLYTGQYATSNGVTCLFKPLLPRQKLLPEVLREHGYHTSHMGKWHLAGGDAPSHFVSPYFRPGWDEWLGWENSNEPFHTEYGCGPMPIPLHTFKSYQTDALTDLTLKWLKSYDRNKPFFHVVSIEPPHPPNNAPEQYMEIFRTKTIEFHPNFSHSHENHTEFEKRLRGYYAQIANLDHNVGRIMQELESCGLLDNTIIFYFSDHGDMLGSHGMLHKSRPEEESSRIPLIIRYPAMLGQNRVSNGLIGAIDIMPSLLSLLGIPVPNSVEGEDLSSLFTGKCNEGRSDLLLQFERNFFDHTDESSMAWRSIRKDKWKYNLFRKGNYRELFNLESDPYEMHNLSESGDHRDICAELHLLLKKRLGEQKDDFPIS